VDPSWLTKIVIRMVIQTEQIQIHRLLQQLMML
jgi:hypothetical protein